MRAFTRKFIETQSTEWLEDFFGDYHNKANAYKKVLLKEHVMLVAKELDKRSLIEQVRAYKASLNK
jgi:hypothetical protein